MFHFCRYSKFSETFLLLLSLIFFIIYFCLKLYTWFYYVVILNLVLNALLLDIIFSWSFSPGLIPITFCVNFGPIALAKSTIFIEGILGTKISPPDILIKDLITKLTDCCREIQNLVIRLSVIGNTFELFLIRLLKISTTLPLEPITFPYLTTANFIGLKPTILFAEVNILSEVNFVAP